MLQQKAGVGIGFVLFFGVQIIYGWRRPILSVHSVLLVVPKEVKKTKHKLSLVTAK